MAPRIHLPQPLRLGVALALPAGPSRHLQVLRLQPGDALTVFNGEGGEWSARILSMGRTVVEIELGTHDAVDRELPCAVTLAVGMPANDRMDDLLEKATELGVAAVQPLVCERSVLRLAGERADKKRAHWQGVVAAASEQSGRTRVPQVGAVRSLADWLATRPAASGAAGTGGKAWCGVLSLRGAQPLQTLLPAGRFPDQVLLLSGPEGGLSPGEEEAARAAGFTALSLGSRVLRADTAPLAALAWIGFAAGG